MERATEDYLLGLSGVYAHADYVTVNISSPNTKNLRSLQTDEALDQLLSALNERKLALANQHQKRVPVFLKIAPDLDDQQISVIAQSLVKHQMDGVIATNTTLSRDAVQGQLYSNEAGGLSGSPVLASSNRVIRLLRQQLGAQFPIIGVGGIMSGYDAVSKIEAGADAVQIYTGLIYKGPALVHEVAKSLSQLPKNLASFNSIA
jgi:dihydroorotate dehydrogenase